MEKQVDVLVVGGCTAGLYFGGLLARAGYSVLVCDKSREEDLGNRFDVIHIGGDQFERFGLHKPAEGDPEYVRTFTHSVIKSALDKWPKKQTSEIVVARRVPLMARLLAWAREGGAQVLFETEFTEAIIENDTLCGGVFTSGGKTLEIRARLTADASGIPSVVRTKLPAGMGVENDELSPRDQFYVVLRYVKLKNPVEDAVKMNTTWLYYKCWLAPREQAGGAIIGVGANLSFDFANKCFERFASRIKLPEYELDYTEQSSTPYRRPLYSFVANGFIALGDAAFITNPWTGEGVPYGWLLSKIAAEVAADALRDGGVATLSALWQTNVRYAKEQGALFAQNIALLPGALGCTPEENDYEFKKAIIFESDEEKGKGKLPLQLLGALFAGGISFNSLKTLLGAATTGGKLYKHYLAYPEGPAGFDSWVQTANAPWSKVISVADLADADL